jgi:hypothetical protein
MEEAVYKILQYYTSGWEAEPNDRKLTKEQAKDRLNQYMSEGVNPNYLKVALDDED